MIYGVITARIALESDPDICSNPAGYIMTFGVHPKFRRFKLGTLLLLKMKEKLIKNYGCKSLILHVKSDNIEAIRFYRKNNFHFARFLKQFYWIDGQHYDAYVLTHPISSIPINIKTSLSSSKTSLLLSNFTIFSQIFVTFFFAFLCFILLFLFQFQFQSLSIFQSQFIFQYLLVSITIITIVSIIFLL
eukprot:c7321_g1_i1.p1 GENE.c7321_g1_i1~~c7321_g1_i1.p1  ORF type:complete len:210 (+),score=51.84 c7321_g1_i1:66-632(+)